MATTMPRTNGTTRTGTMRAWAINAYGERERLQQLPRPVPRGDDVLIRMAGGEIGVWDAMVRDGEWPMERPFPLVLGLAGSGTVADLGPDAEGFHEGEGVFAYTYPMYDNGAWAEYMLVPTAYAAPTPASMEPARAGVVPTVGLTAHETLIDILKIRKDELVLITAASGGVGHLAVQIAKDRGARVIGTASSRNHEFVLSLGADTVIDYDKEDLVQAIRDRFPEGMDKALNCVEGKGADQTAQTLRDGGSMVDLTGSITRKRHGVTIITDYAVQGDGERLRKLTTMIDQKRLRVVIQEEFAFEREPEALNNVLEGHTRGKVLLRIS